MRSCCLRAIRSIPRAARRYRFSTGMQVHWWAACSRGTRRFATARATLPSSSGSTFSRSGTPYESRPSSAETRRHAPRPGSPAAHSAQGATFRPPALAFRPRDVHCGWCRPLRPYLRSPVTTVPTFASRGRRSSNSAGSFSVRLQSFLVEYKPTLGIHAWSPMSGLDASREGNRSNSRADSMRAHTPKAA